MGNCPRNKAYKIVDGHYIARRHNKHKGSRNKHNALTLYSVHQHKLYGAKCPFRHCIERDKASVGLDMHIDMNRRASLVRK